MYRIAISTYKRYNGVITLGLFPEDLFERYLFVNTEEEKAEYAKHYPDITTVVTNKKGITPTRNAIIDYFKEGEVIMADDDIQNIQSLNQDGKGVTNATPEEIYALAQSGFNACKEKGTKLWGVYPVPNDFYMGQKTTYYNFVIGSFCGVIIDKLRFDEAFLTKEDYDFTVQNILTYGKIIRFDNWTVKAKHYVNEGGCVELRKKFNGVDFASTDGLIRKWGSFFKKNPKRAGEVLTQSRALQKFVEGRKR